MRQIIFLLTISLLFISCGQNDTKQKELELKERELAVKERELALKEKDTAPVKTAPQNIAQEVKYKSYTICAFKISLPSNFKLINSSDNDHPSIYCDYSVKTKDGFEIIQLHSLAASRFESSTIEELYEGALKEPGFDISYKTQNKNWFVISGINKDNGNYLYCKRVLGSMFVNDLRIEYPKSRESEIKPYIETIANSFTSQ